MHQAPHGHGDTQEQRHIDRRSNKDPLRPSNRDSAPMMKSEHIAELRQLLARCKVRGGAVIDSRVEAREG